MPCNFTLKLFQVINIILLGNCGQIRIIDGPFSLQHAGIQTYNPAPVEAKLVAKVKPQRLSGPPHLFTLAGQCFILQKTSYKYEFCPFHNITQRENSYRWNSFHGVLGVWKEWRINNRSFECMVMTDGEDCLGAFKREVLVYFKCGNEHKLIDIEEPTTCKYNLTFQTPLACAIDGFLVYPAMTDAGRDEWDAIEDEYERKELTIQGYKKERKALFVKEGFLVDEESQKREESSTAASSVQSKLHQGDVDYHSFTREQCIENYGKLLEEVKRLRKLLNATNTSNKEENTTLAASKDVNVTNNRNERTEQTDFQKNSIKFEANESIGKVEGKIFSQKQNPAHIDLRKTINFIKSTHKRLVLKRERSKKRKGKMGDDGFLNEKEESRKEKGKGHWLGRSINVAKKILGSENDVNSLSRKKLTNNQDLSHLYH